MRVFISWSGQTSREIADAFRDWLPYVIQYTKPFVSTDDIAKGTRWSDAIANELNEAAYGIVCITRDNYKAPWINFEAGAISKAIKSACVSPFLFNIEPSGISGPLQQFQLTTFREKDVLRLVSSLNDAADAEKQLAPDLLKREFDAWWPDFKSRLEKLAAIVPVETATGFDWLYTVEDLLTFQAQGHWKCIWIITPDPYRNVLRPPMREVIQGNAATKIPYSILVPHCSNDADNGKDVLEQIVTQGSIREIPEEEFSSLAITDYIVMHPAADAAPQVFLELPIPDTGFWIRLDDRGASGIVRRFGKLQQLGPA